MSGIWLIRSTFAKKEEAVSISRTLLEEKLVACANIQDSILALFHWEDMLQQEYEAVALYKTTDARVARVIARIKTLHSYQLPSITAWEAAVCEPGFAAWVNAEVA
jgi:periplasmic divalent cation tolerance protein